MRQFVFVVVVLALVAAFTGCATTGNQAYEKQLEYRVSEINSLQSRISQLEAELQARNSIMTDWGSNQASPIMSPIMSSPETYSASSDKVDELKKKGYDVELRDGFIAVQLSGTVLFDPGKATLTKAGKAELDKALKLVKEEFPDALLRVDGHTDNVPITKSKNEFDSNWDLSAKRAVTVLSYLVKTGKLDDKKIYAAAFGETKPIADNKTDKGKKANRRVELVILQK